MAQRTAWVQVAKKKELRIDYDVGRDVLGSGMHSTVRSCTERSTGRRFAVKRVEKVSGDTMKCVQSEVKILRRIKHQHIIGFKSVYESDTDVDIVLELASGGELFERIKNRGSLTEKAASRILRQLLTACAFLHSNGIVHRDVKPENILFSTADDDSDIKLADFGLARTAGEEPLYTPCGTAGYIAPEVARAEAYSKAVDMWAVGCILYTLLSGYVPFYHEDAATMQSLIAAGTFSFPAAAWTGVSDAAKDLVSCLLRVDPATRYTAEQALKHPWVAVDSGGPGVLLRSPAVMRELSSHPRRSLKAELDISIQGTSQKTIQCEAVPSSDLWERRHRMPESAAAVRLDVIPPSEETTTASLPRSDSTQRITPPAISTPPELQRKKHRSSGSNSE